MADTQGRLGALAELFGDAARQILAHPLRSLLTLSGIVFGGRMPNFAKFRKKVADPKDYLDQVQAGKIHDPVIRFQLAKPRCSMLVTQPNAIIGQASITR